MKGTALSCSSPAVCSWASHCPALVLLSVLALSFGEGGMVQNVRRPRSVEATGPPSVLSNSSGGWGSPISERLRLCLLSFMAPYRELNQCGIRSSALRHGLLRKNQFKLTECTYPALRPSPCP